MYFCVNEFEVGVNDSILSGDEQQKMYFEAFTVFTALLWVYCRALT